MGGINTEGPGRGDRRGSAKHPGGDQRAENGGTLLARGTTGPGGSGGAKRGREAAPSQKDQGVKDV